MNTDRWSIGRSLACAACTTVAIIAGHTAIAELPDSASTFSLSTTIDNPYFPIVPGAVKVFEGREQRRRVTTVTKHGEDVREFLWHDAAITCRAIDTHAFVDGRLKSVQTAYYAQSDDGAVYQFGELRRSQGSGNGWVVGPLQADDPEATESSNEPSLVVPGIPETGDRWTTSQHVFEVRNADARVHVRGGTLRHTLRIVRMVPGERAFETSWLAPGLGPVKWRSDGSRLRLDATTLGARRGRTRR